MDSTSIVSIGIIDTMKNIDFCFCKISKRFNIINKEVVEDVINGN